MPPSLPSAQQLLSKGVVAPTQYPRDARFPSPYPPLTPNAVPGTSQEQPTAEWQAVQSRNQIAKLEIPQPRHGRTEQPNAAPNKAVQSSSEATVTVKRGAPTAPRAHQQRLYPSMLNTPADAASVASILSPLSSKRPQTQTQFQKVLSGETPGVELMDGVKYSTSSQQKPFSSTVAGPDPPLSKKHSPKKRYAVPNDLAMEVATPPPKRSKKTHSGIPAPPPVNEAASIPHASTPGGSVKTLPSGHTVYNSAAELEFERQKLVQNAVQRVISTGENKSNPIVLETEDTAVARPSDMEVIDNEIQQPQPQKAKQDPRQPQKTKRVADADQSQPKIFPCTFCGKEYTRRCDRTKHGNFNPQLTLLLTQKPTPAAAVAPSNNTGRKPDKFPSRLQSVRAVSLLEKPASTPTPGENSSTKGRITSPSMDLSLEEAAPATSIEPVLTSPSHSKSNTQVPKSPTTEPSHDPETLVESSTECRNDRISPLALPEPMLISIPKPKTASSAFFPVGGDWTMHQLNGQVKRVAVFTLKDVLAAAERSHLSDAMGKAFEEHMEKERKELLRKKRRRKVFPRGGSVSG
ncbi:hypothetical protein K440DRAFT_639004 [Wilcoxina mikolae CBS 423.85]|nr:hypothetical protein K440DRAFT_639004 [Wilcoxina mikolae CBS 423.85]